MVLLVNKLENQFNDQLLYAIYKLLKMKSDWFEGCHSEIQRVMELTLEKELIAKSRGLIGKILGLLLKNNPGIVSIVLKR